MSCKSTQETKTCLSIILEANKSRMQGREEVSEIEKIANLIHHYVHNPWNLKCMGWTIFLKLLLFLHPLPEVCLRSHLAFKSHPCLATLADDGRCASSHATEYLRSEQAPDVLRTTFQDIRAYTGIGCIGYSVTIFYPLRAWGLFIVWCLVYV